MTGFQKVIKACAICLAIFIIINIFSAVIFGVSLMSHLGDNKSESVSLEKDFTQEYEGINRIKIDLIGANLTIKNGDKLKVEAKDSNYKLSSKVINNTLRLEEKKHNFFNTKLSGNITLYIPKNTNLEELDIDTGAGKIYIEGIKADEFDIDTGAGVLEILDSKFSKTNIDGGAGEIRIENSILNNLKLAAGVGKVTLNAKITGKSKVECGIGELNVELIGDKEDYKIIAEKGIGSIKVNNIKQSSDTTYGTGNNVIKLEGGIGSIKVDFVLDTNNNI